MQLSAVPKGLVMALSRQAWLCYWCDILMLLDGDPASRPTREHIVPRSQGGRGTGNIVAACYSCNHARGSFSGPPGRHAQMRRAMYMRAAGIYCEMPSSRNRRTEVPNFGYGPDGDTRLWAPQFGIVYGPERVMNLDRRKPPQLRGVAAAMQAYIDRPGVAQW